jgi:CRP-like cAMP-binding protein
MDKMRKSKHSIHGLEFLNRGSRKSVLDLAQNQNQKISYKKLFETFKDSQVDFIILNSLYKLSSGINKKRLENDIKNFLFTRIFENIKKKNLFFFFLQFYKINDDLLKKIIPHLKYEYYQKGGHLFTENDIPMKLYFIIRGFITFHKNEIIFDSKNNPSVVDVEKYILGPDEYFGESDLIYDKKKSESAFCKTECHLITINRDNFKKLLEEKISKVELEKKLYIFSFLQNFSRIPKIRMEKFYMNHVKTLFFRRNKIIYKEGEQNNGLYIIYRGEAIIINDIKKGEFYFIKNLNERIKYIQKKAIGLNYVDIIKNTKIKSNEKILLNKETNKNINNEKELSELNLLLNKIKYNTICRMTKGAIGGLEIVTGINKLKYSLLSNSDFTCVIKIELKNIDDYLSNFLINLIPVFVKFEKNIHERIKNIKLIDETITPSSVKKLKDNKKDKYEKKVEEENDKIYKRKIQKIDDSFQLNYGGFIKNNDFNYNLYQQKLYYKELLKQNKKKISNIEKFLKYLDIEEHSIQKYTEFKMQKCKSAVRLLKYPKDIIRIRSKKLINLNIKSEQNSLELIKQRNKRLKKHKLTWKFFNTETRPIKKKESIKNLDRFFFKSNEKEKKYSKDLDLLHERQSLSIDSDYRKKVFVYGSPKIKINNRYRTKQLFFMTPKKNSSINNYDSEEKENTKNHKNKNIQALKEIFLYDTGNFDIPLLSEEFT